MAINLRELPGRRCHRPWRRRASSRLCGAQDASRAVAVVEALDLWRAGCRRNSR